MNGPTRRRPPFGFSAFTRVGFSDTDAQGVVYYGRYMPYFDFARVEYMRHLGLLEFETGMQEFAMRALSVEYRAPARFDDAMEVFVRQKRIGRTSATWDFAACRREDDELLVTAEQVVVMIDAETRRTCEIPQTYRDAVTRFEGGALDA